MNPVFKKIIEKNIKNFKYPKEAGTIAYLSNYAYLPMNVLIDSFLNIFEFKHQKKYDEDCQKFLKDEKNYYFGVVKDTNCIYLNKLCLITPEKKAFILNDHSTQNEEVCWDLNQVDLKNDDKIIRVIKDTINKPIELDALISVINQGESLRLNNKKIVEILNITYEKQKFDTMLNSEVNPSPASFKRKI